MNLPRKDDTFPCSECQAGVMHRQFMTYLTWLGNELITVPDFPAWVCDVCGRREYDAQALNRLSLLLSENTGRPNQRPARKAPKQPPEKPPRPSKNRD